MTDSLATTRLTLPMLAAAQAQKEVTHNEALTLLDLAIAPLVEEVNASVPPTTPAIGQQWIVGAAPSGAWIGQAGALAGWTAAGWRFVHLPVGAHVTERATMLQWRREAESWVRPPTVAPANGGATVDNECRAQLSALIAALVLCGHLAA